MIGSFLQFWTRRRPRHVNCAVLRLELRCRGQLATILKPETAVALLSEFSNRVAAVTAAASGIAHAVDAGDYLIAIPEDANPNCHIDACRLVFKMTSEVCAVLSAAPLPQDFFTKDKAIAAGATFGPTLLTEGSLPIPIIGETANEAHRLLQWAKSLDTIFLAGAPLVDRLESHAVMREHLLGKDARAWDVLRLSEPHTI